MQQKDASCRTIFKTKEQRTPPICNAKRISYWLRCCQCQHYSQYGGKNLREFILAVIVCRNLLKLTNHLRVFPSYRRIRGGYLTVISQFHGVQRIRDRTYMDKTVKKRGQKWSSELVRSRCRFRSTSSSFSKAGSIEKRKAIRRNQ